MAKKGMKRYYEKHSKEAIVPEINGKAKTGNEKASVTFYYTDDKTGDHYTEQKKIY
ncbi:hypothetical protein SAMN02745196_00213 [Clostridium collagenovorans DSM 3089]|uniref:Uncharacterized protein n=1 Tax=Clostridium collagenovorans DSM 3089 TaxID=1121306 RepID=A0A1M5SL04_9CLOT|nr:hypothetical protein [Clostridium collagenovorans]SHH39242.1 hypothetical protein SAMN02745196_00213 [Clostridium collagenovorans DSM 3089]